MMDSDKLILVGVITAAKGIKGEAIVKSFTEQQANIVALNLVDDQGKQVKLELSRKSSKGELICRINNLATRNEIEKLRGKQLFCFAKELPILEENEFYINNLKDKLVVDKSHKPIGFVRKVMNFGAGDLLELEFNNQQKQIFSFNSQNFPEVTDTYLMFIPPIIIK